MVKYSKELEDHINAALAYEAVCREYGDTLRGATHEDIATRGGAVREAVASIAIAEVNQIETREAYLTSVRTRAPAYVEGNREHHELLVEIRDLLRTLVQK